MSDNAKELASTTARKKALLSALESSLGIVSTACKAAEVSRETFYTWKREDEAFKNAYESLKDLALDFAESKLLQKINGVEMVKNTADGPVVYELAPSDTAIIFYLKTQGKERGYIERQEITGKDGKDLYKDMSDEDLDNQLNDQS